MAKERKTPKNGEAQEQNSQQLNSKSTVKAAIAELRRAREFLAEFTRERAGRQLSVGNLSSMGKELSDIERRLMRFDED